MSAFSHLRNIGFSEDLPSVMANSPAIQAVKAQVRADQQARLAAKLITLGNTPEQVAELLVHGGATVSPMASLASPKSSKSHQRATPRAKVVTEEVFKSESSGSSAMIMVAFVAALLAFIYMQF